MEQAMIIVNYLLCHLVSEAGYNEEPLKNHANQEIIKESLMNRVPVNMIRLIRQETGITKEFFYSTPPGKLDSGNPEIRKIANHLPYSCTVLKRMSLLSAKTIVDIVFHNYNQYGLENWGHPDLTPHWENNLEHNNEPEDSLSK